MYLHIGNNRIIKTGSIIGIFDMDTATVSRTTRAFLREAEQNGKIEHASDEIPKSFLLTDDGLYTSQISPAHLCGRVEREI